jgi:hypothetical protein
VSLTYRSHPTVVPLVLCLLLGMGACKRDEGAERLARAKAKYAELLEQGVPMGNPAWEAVIAELESVPGDSKARPEAEQWLATLRELRTPLPPRPLARPGVPDGGSPSLDEHGHPR